MAANVSSVRTVPPSSTCSNPDAPDEFSAVKASAHAPAVVNACDAGLPSDTHSQTESVKERARDRERESAQD